MIAEAKGDVINVAKIGANGGYEGKSGDIDAAESQMSAILVLSPRTDGITFCFQALIRVLGAYCIVFIWARTSAFISDLLVSSSSPRQATQASHVHYHINHWLRTGQEASTLGSLIADPTSISNVLVTADFNAPKKRLPPH